MISAFDQPNSAVDTLIGKAEVDVLQLDYRWPNLGPIQKRYAQGLLHQLRTLHKSLYLDPKVHLITNAGGGDPTGCVEAVGQFYCAHGDERVPLTAIRGENVLPQLEELMSAGVKLQDRATGITFHALEQSIVAAQVELGAGPLATAWDEGSRLVVVGSYDLAAPMIAAAVSAFQWPWDPTDVLAQLAVAAHWPQVLIEIGPHAELTIEAPPGTHLDVAQLRQKVLEAADPNGRLRHADIHCQVSALELEESSPGKFCAAGVEGLETSEEWLLQLTYRDGFFSEAQFECLDVAAGENAVDLLQDLLKLDNKKCPAVQIDLLSANENDAHALLRVCCRSQDRARCAKFDSEVANLSLQSVMPNCQLIGSLPRWQSKFSQITCPVPREAIAVSVDTRPAKDWR